MKNKVLMLLMSMILMISISACTEQSNTSVQEESTQVNSEEVTSEKELVEKQDIEDTSIDQTKEEIQIEKQEQEIKVYYLDDQAENLVEKQMSIEKNDNDSLEKLIVESLKTKPTDSSIHNVMDESVKINSVEVADKVAKVDFSSQGLNGSSTQELFLKDAIILALTNLEVVEHVQFLVDGKVAETLMGHIDISEPFTREDVQSTVIKD